MTAARAARHIVLAAALTAAGCSDAENVRVLEEAQPQSKSRTIPADQKLFRTLAAMVPTDGEARENDPHWWFFKLSGKADVIAKHESDFNKLIESIHTQPNDENPITWKLPEGWTRERGSQLRFATLKSPDGQAEISVTQFGGLVFMNVQRWWTQLWGKERGSDVTAANVLDFARQRTVNGRVLFTVDMSGPKDPNAKDPSMMGGPMMNPHGGQ